MGKRYAFISDVHGNLPALQAVLDDAKAQCVDEIFLLGDYVEDFPWPNEVVEVIRGIENAAIIRGNKEGYLESIRNAGQSRSFHAQMAAVDWSYDELLENNLNYLISLPESQRISTGGDGKIYLSHSFFLFDRVLGLNMFRSSQYEILMEEKSFDHEQYLKLSRRAVLENEEAMERLSRIPKGIHGFGHNHLQWHMETQGRLLVNPGSCGMPSDFDIRAPYTIVSENSDGFCVDERRVPYDVQGTIAALQASDLFKRAPVWSRAVMKATATAKDHMSLLVHFIDDYAKKQGYMERPVSDEIFYEASSIFFNNFDVY